MSLPYPSFASAPEPYADRSAPSGCESEPGAGVVMFRDFVLAELGGSDLGVMRACSLGPPSHHHEGRAWDWGLDAGKEADRARAEALINWLLAPDDAGEPDAMLRRSGIDYLIWNKRIWTSSTRQWTPYDGFDAAGECAATGGCRNPHTDHVHISFGWPGARGETSFYDWLRTGPDEPFPRVPNAPVPVPAPTERPGGVLRLAVWTAAAASAYLIARTAHRSSGGVGISRATRRS
jgi:hypothetical protein